MAASPAGRDGGLTVPVAAAFVVLTANFGALCLFWTFGPRTPGLPGPFDFASVTWGDSLALPAMTGLLTYAVRTLPPARADRAFAVTAAALAGAAGATSQVLWLAAAHPHPNWTLPRAHHFTVAGWYHAAFVTVFCAALATLLALALNRATRALRPPHQAAPAATASNTTASDATGMNVTASGTTGIDATGSGATAYGATSSDATGSDATGYGATGSDATGYGATGSGAAGSRPPSQDPPWQALMAIATAFVCGLAFASLLASDAGTTPTNAGLAGVLLAVPTALLTAGVLAARRARRTRNAHDVRT